MVARALRVGPKLRALDLVPVLRHAARELRWPEEGRATHVDDDRIPGTKTTLSRSRLQALLGVLHLRTTSAPLFLDAALSPMAFLLLFARSHAVDDATQGPD